MWISKSLPFVLCLIFISTAFALPTSKSENESEIAKPEPVLLELVETPAAEKPTDNSKPSEMGVDPKPMEVKPTEQTKPSASPSPVATFIESIPLEVTPPRPQMLFDQRQDGKYNIRADLENFVILVVPSSGNSLLDLLKHANQRQQPHNKRQHHTKHHKKYNQAVASAKPVETKKASSRLDYLNGETDVALNGGEYIEGRTPYHVDITSDEIQPAAYGSVSGGVRSIADIPLINLDENTASTSGASDTTILLSTVTGKNVFNSMPTSTTSNTESSPRLPKSITIGGYGKYPAFNSVLLTPNSYDNNQHDSSQLSKNYNNYFSRKPSLQIVDIRMDNTDVTNLLNTQNSEPSTDLTNSFDSLNVGNIDRLALAGDSTTKTDADLANKQWELTLLGAEEQCGPDRRRDSYGVCQFVPADYATATT